MAGSELNSVPMTLLHNRWATPEIVFPLQIAVAGAAGSVYWGRLGSGSIALALALLGGGALAARRAPRGGAAWIQIVEALRSYVFSWKSYFHLAQTPKVMLGLDEWLRHRLRAAQLKQWRRGKTIFRNLIALGAHPEMARSAAANSRR